MSGWQEGLMPDEPALSRDLRPRAADDDRRRRGGNGAPGSAVITRTKPQTKKPSLYRVLILNDDYTPMEFVVDVLQRIFGMDRTKATRIMLEVHTRGKGVCGVYTYEIAETKVAQVNAYSRQHQHPLLCTMEES
jgi:ATP-dependent Clp protease adaptor protein ClpS